MKKQLLLIFILLICVILNSEEKWNNIKVSFYQIYYTNEDKKIINEIKDYLNNFNKKMVDFLKIDKTKIFFKESNVNIYLYPKNNTEVQVYSYNLDGGTKGDSNKIVYNGTFKLCGLSSYDNKEYFYKDFTTGLSVVYLQSICSVNNIRFYNLDNWFVQGMKEYVGVYYSTVFWSNEGYKNYLKRLVSNPDGIDTNFGLNIKDSYKDGFLMFQFLKDVYGEAIIYKFLTNTNDTFGKKVMSLLNVDLNTFTDQINI